MSGARFFARAVTASMLSALLALACSGKSTSSDDGGNDDESGGTAGSGGATAGSTSKGGAGPTGGTSTGGSSGTSGVPPDGTCDDVVPCGGDPAGSWVISENCLEAVVPGLFADTPGCENVVPVGSGTLTGTFTFENGMATQTTQQVVDVTVVIDDPCAEALSGLSGVTAADLCPLIDAQLMMDAETPADCVATADGCRCDGTQTSPPTTETDTYEVIGNRLVLGSGDSFDFCQEGDEMSLSGATVDATSGATAEILVLLDRQ